MKTRAAVAYAVNEPWTVEDMEVAEPGPGEIMVKLAYAGLCHSDEHIRMGDLTEAALPMVCGHEGAGIVESIGVGVSRVAVGDHVAASFIPSCGVCPSCSTGHQNLCDLGGQTMIADPRFTGSRGLVRAMAGLGTFSNYMTVLEQSVVKIGDWYPLDAAALVSCGVATGWGSAVNVAEVTAGQTVVVVGIGGIGSNAVQGAAMSGAVNIIAVDPVEMKREFAQTIGATHSAASMEDALPLLDEITWGQKADAVIMTVGDAEGHLFAPALALVKKGGNLTLTSLSKIEQMDVSINMFDLAMNQKQIRGNVFGGCNPQADIPRLLRLYEQGQMKLDELITKRYRLDEINEAYAAMHGGEQIRGVIDFT